MNLFHVIPAINQREYSHQVVPQTSPKPAKKKQPQTTPIIPIKVAKCVSPQSSMESVVLESKSMQLSDRSPEALKLKMGQRP